MFSILNPVMISQNVHLPFGTENAIARCLRLVAVRMSLLESPKISTHCLQILVGDEAELLLGQSGISRQIRNVSKSILISHPDLGTHFHIVHSPSTDNLVFVVVSGSLLHGVDHVQHAHAFTLSKVESSVVAILLGVDGREDTT